MSLVAALTPSPAFAVDVPLPGAIVVQTNGPGAPAADGDWYTANGSQHYVRFTIPCGWPSSEAVYVDLFSPEMNTDAAAAGVTEQATGTLDTTEFELYGPGASGTPAPGTGVPGTRTLWRPSPAGDAETFFPWATIFPATCGDYLVRTAVVGGDPVNPTGGNDDHNGWRMRVGRDDDIDVTNPPPANSDDFDALRGTGDEITAGPVQVSFRHTGGAEACLTLYEHVPPGRPAVVFHNFGMGGVGRVRYYAPGDVLDPTATAGGVPGTVSSTEGTWNGGTALTRGGDSITSPAPGWWRIVTCTSGGQQFVQEGQTGVPAYLEPPPDPLLSVAVTDGQTVVSRGQSLSYAITVSNVSSGPTAGAAIGTTVAIPVPAGLTGASCALVAPATGTCSVAGGTATATFSSTIVAGTQAAVTLSATVAASASGPVPVTANATWTDVAGNPYGPASGTDTDTVRSADLVLTLTATPEPVYHGTTLTYTLSVANNGPDDATDLVLADILPAGLTPSTASGAGWTCGIAGSDVTCTRPAQPAGTTSTVTITALVTATSGSLTGSASVTTTAADPTPATATATSTVLTRADLGVTKSHIGSFTHGQVGFYQLTASNAGPSPTTGTVRITDTLPAGLSYASASGAGWFCSAAGQVVTCDRPAGLGIGESAPVTLVVDVTTAAAAFVTNTATVSGPDPDGNPANDTATDPTAVETASIAGLVWNDADGDGTRQVSEPGMAGVTVTATGPVTRTATTAVDGTYRFVGLLPGTYSVAVTPPAKHVATTTDPVPVTLLSGQQVTGVATGLRYVNTPPAVGNDTATTPEDTPVTVGVLGNDTDVDGDPLTVTGSTDGGFGSVACTATTCTYTPDPDANGVDTFTYTVFDGDDGTTTGTVTVTVTPVNDLPVFTGAVANTSQTVPVFGTLSSLAAIDADGDLLTYSVTGGVLPPGVTLNPDGSFGGGAGAPGAYSVTIEVADGNGGTDTTTLAVQVGGPTANTPPNAVNDLATTPEDTPVTVGVLANDTDVDLDPLAITGSADGSLGTASCSATSCTFTPAPGASGTGTFTYTIADGSGGTATATVTVTVTAVNDVPVFTGAVANTSQTVPVFGTLSSLAAIDADGDLLTYSVTGGVLPPGVTLNPDGSFGGGAGAPGAYSVTIEVADGNGGTDTTTLAVQVGGPTANTPPNAVNDLATTPEDTPVTVGVLANDTDVDLDPLAVTTWTNGTFGTVSCSGQTCTYTPGPNFNGTDTFTYTVDDGSDGTDTAVVSVTVTPVNDPPAYTAAARNTGQVIPVGGSLQPLQATDVEADPLAYTLVGGTLPPGVGLNPDGSFSGIASGPGTFTSTIRVADGNGGIDDTTLVVTVGGPSANTPPAATDDVLVADEDTPGTVDVLANDTDVDLDALTVTGWTNGSFGSVSCGPAGCSYTPNPNANGNDTFTYTVADGSGGTDVGVVAVIVRAVNDLPVATDDVRNTPEDTPRALTTLLGNDTDVDGDVLTILSVTQPANGSVTCGLTACTYTPNANFTGPDPFTYTVTDSAGGTDVATVFMTVGPVNDPPDAVDDPVTTPEDTPVTIAVLANDTDVEGATLTVTGQTAPASGGAACGPSSCTYTPGPNFNGTDSFTYTVSDGAGGTDTATVTVTVAPVNDPPVAGDDTATVAEDGSVSVPVTANDTDVDLDTLAAAVATPPANGTASCSGPACSYTPAPDFAGTDSFTYTVSDGAGGTGTATVTVTVTAVDDGPVGADDAGTIPEDTPVTVDVLGNDTDVENDPLTITGTTPPANGSVTCAATCVYTPDPDFHGTDSFTYTVSDGTLTDVATVTVTVSPVNDAPVAVDDTATTPEDTPVTIPVTANDTDVDGDPLVVTGPATCGPAACTYTPGPDFNGTDTFTYTVSDGTVSVTATVTVTVTPVNDAPAAADDAATTSEDTPVAVDVLANDTDVDSPALTATLGTAPASGSASCAGATCTYTPDPDFNGTDSFTYTVSDGALTATATVTVTVGDANDPPVPVPDAVTTAEDTPVTIPLLGNDTDVDGDPLTIAGTTAPAHGSLACDATTCTYTPDDDYAGPDSFTYDVTDGTVTVTAVVTIAVTEVNDPPVVLPDVAVVAHGGEISVPILGNDADPDGDPLAISGFTQGAHGQVTCSANSCTYRADPGYAGPDSFTYTVSDGRGGTATGRVDVTVQAAVVAPGDGGGDGTPRTGSATRELVAVASGLLLAGALSLAAGAAVRRRRPA